MIIKVQNTPKINLVNEGSYTSKFADIKPIKTSTGDALRLTFEITNDQEGENNKVNGLCGTYLHPESKLYKWLSAIKGSEFAIDEEVDITKLIGMECVISVAHTQNNGRTFANVVDVTSSDDSADVPF